MRRPANFYFRWWVYLIIAFGFVAIVVVTSKGIPFKSAFGVLALYFALSAGMLFVQQSRQDSALPPPEFPSADHAKREYKNDLYEAAHRILEGCEDTKKTGFSCDVCNRLARMLKKFGDLS